MSGDLDPSTQAEALLGAAFTADCAAEVLMAQVNGLRDAAAGMRARAAAVVAEPTNDETEVPVPTPLPTGFGARVRADVCGERVRLVLVYTRKAWEGDDALVWAAERPVGPGVWFPADALTNVEILDPGEPEAGVAS